MHRLKRILSLILVIVTVISNFVIIHSQKTERFSDVPSGHWADTVIHDLRALNITQGKGNNQFGLGQTISRSEFVTMLVNLMKWELVEPEEGSFIDNMKTDKWYYPSIETALKYGVILRDSDRFRPDENITREEMAIMIVRTLGYENLANQLTYLGSPFEDVTRNTGYITIARDFGIINGVGHNQFKPNDTAKREEAAAMMMRMYGKLQSSIEELHGFYAIRSAEQAYMIPSLDSVGFGWSRLEYDAKTQQIILNTTRSNNNEYAIPTGFSGPLSQAKDNEAKTQLMIFAKNDRVYNEETKTHVPLLEYILTNDEIRRQVILDIQAVLKTNKPEFDGVVIDFEELKGEVLKEALNIFLKELREILEEEALIYIAVHPARRHGQAYYDAYDYKRIGEITDKVILMAHDYYAKQLTDSDMQRGYTLTPLAPIDEVYYALRAITDQETGVQDKSKIWLQVSFDSVQWKLKEGKVINRTPYNPGYEAIQQRLRMEGTTINYSERYQSPYATYYDDRDGTENVLWYEDSRSVQAKVNLAKMFGVQGISLWRLGNVPDYNEAEGKKIFLDVWERIKK